MKGMLLLLFFCFFYSGKLFSDQLTQSPRVRVCRILTGDDRSPFSVIGFELLNFPKNKKIKLNVLKPLSNESKTISCCTIDENGRINIGRLPSIDLLYILTEGFYYGERVIFDFIVDEEIIFQLTLVPNLLVAVNKTGDIKAHAELIQLKPSRYVIFVEGLKEKEQYAVTRSSSGLLDRIRDRFEPTHCCTLSPDVPWKKSGVGKVFIDVRKQRLTLELPWGNALEDYAYKPKRLKGKMLSSKIHLYAHSPLLGTKELNRGSFPEISKKPCFFIELSREYLEEQLAQ